MKLCAKVLGLVLVTHPFQQLTCASKERDEVRHTPRRLRSKSPAVVLPGVDLTSLQNNFISPLAEIMEMKKLKSTKGSGPPSMAMAPKSTKCKTKSSKSFKSSKTPKSSKSPKGSNDEPEFDCEEALSVSPTGAPSVTSGAPSVTASNVPSVTASNAPSTTASSAPSVMASGAPSVTASNVPSVTASNAPSVTASSAPSVKASSIPSLSLVPSLSPSAVCASEAGRLQDARQIVENVSGTFEDSSAQGLALEWLLNVDNSTTCESDRIMSVSILFDG